MAWATNIIFTNVAFLPTVRPKFAVSFQGIYCDFEASTVIQCQRASELTAWQLGVEQIFTVSDMDWSQRC